MLTLVVWTSYHIEGVRKKGLFGYLKSWVPAGITGFTAVPIFLIEALSHFVRLISLSARLFANMLAGHLLLVSFAVITAALATIGPTLIVFPFSFGLLVFLTTFEVLVAFLQAYIFTILAAVYIADAMHPAH